MRKIRNELTDHQEVLKKNFQLIEKSVIEISKIIKKNY